MNDKLIDFIFIYTVALVGFISFILSWTLLYDGTYDEEDDDEFFIKCKKEYENKRKH